MANEDYVSPAEAAKSAEIVDAAEILRPYRRRKPRDQDPENYERREHDGVAYYAPTQKRADELRQLFQDHVKAQDPEFGWKGEVSATVPAAIADDVAEAMNFVGAIVDDEQELEDGSVRLWSEGYWAHGF